MPDPGNVNDILNGLPPETKKYQYKGTQDILDVTMDAQFSLDNEKNERISEYIIYSGVSERVFIELAESDQELISKSIDSYNSTFQILLLKLKNTVLEKAYTAVADVIMDKLAKMGNPALIQRPTGKDLVHTAARKKRADQEFQPRDLPEGRSNAWPSAIVEVGYTDAKMKLQSDAQWWMGTSKAAVKLGLIVLVNRQMREVSIQKWELVDRQTRTEPERQVAVLKQQSVVSNREGKQETIAVTDAPLVISFQDLFLRRPKEPEGDIVFTEEDLRHIAKLIWGRQSF